MKRKTLWTVLIAIIVIGGIGAGVAYNMWNKPHTRAEDVKGVSITTDALCAEYAADETAANGKYLNKVLEVSGTVSGQETNQDGATVITIQGSNPDVSVLCTMRDKNVQATAGAAVTVKGFCSGADLFGVKLTDCIIQ